MITKTWDKTRPLILTTLRFENCRCNEGLVILILILNVFNTLILLIQLSHYYIKSVTKQCVHREGFKHSYAIKWIKMFLVIKKSLFHQM